MFYKFKMRRRVQVEQVGSSGVKLGQMGSSRFICDQEGPKAVNWGLVGLGRIKSGLVRLTKWMGEWLIERLVER